MKKLIPILLLAIILLSCQNKADKKDMQEPSAVNFSLQELWSTDTIFKTPESVYYDSKREVLYVANMNRIDEGETGFISKLATDGSVLELEWIKGLKEPRGMGVYGDLLFAVDSDRLLIIDIEKNTIKTIVPIAGASFLNDLAIADDGTVYFSDSNEGKVHVYKNNKVTTWLDSLPKPNGLFVEKDRIMLNCVANQTLNSVNKNTGELTQIAEGMGAADGLEYSGIENYYIVTDWSGQIHLIGNDTIMTLLDTREQKINTADLGYDIATRTMYIPTFYNNRIVAYKLKSE